MKCDVCNCLATTDAKKRIQAYVVISSKIKRIQDTLLDETEIECLNYILEVIDGEVEYWESRSHSDSSYS